MTTANSKLSSLTSRLTRGDNLTRDETSDLMNCLLSETATDGEIAAALVGWANKGETVDELVGCATAMRANALRINARYKSFLDTAGTGSSRAKTFNVSTAAAFVVAGAGVPVAKHGNRGVTSRTGSSDVLAALGVRIDALPEITEKCLNELGICFMFAPLYHGTTKRVAAVRRELGIRTIFNLLGPLTNPAGAPFQIVGVSKAAQVEPLAKALSALGTKRAWVVHGVDGLDEITLAGKTLVAEACDGSVQTFEVSPEDFGMTRASLTDLASPDPETSAQIIRQVLTERMQGVARDLIVANAAAALLVAEAAGCLTEAKRLAENSIDSGAAAQKLNDLVKGSNTGVMSDFLVSITEKKRTRVASLKSTRPIDQVRDEAYRKRDGAPAHALRQALRDERAINIIAEIKKASPSKGELCADDITPEEVARAYERGGAVGISVLTEEDYFRGSLNDLTQVRAAVSVPVLRKDFVVDEYQIYEAAAAGADAVLLITALLAESQLAKLRRIAEDELGMDSLVEVHNAEELGQAAASGATLIGVNNRNLHTFEVSLDVSVEIMAIAPRGVLMISESGLSSGEQVKRLRAIGYRGFLIGERFMRSKDAEASLRTMIQEAETKLHGTSKGLRHHKS